ncbi:MAG: nucleotide-diphospho-sugar transferase [Phycisphaerae bacterium]|nr:nucleotide-diphospho-sugar transferase [Saprospiraceae bacterium]
MDYRCTTPILLLLFNRPKHTEAVLERLREVQPTQVFVHCDGPRDGVEGEAEKVAAIRAQIEKIDWPCEVRTLFREQNAGLRAGVYGALNWFFEAVEQGIIIEDDCLPDLSFFPFCEAMLEQYAHEEQVMHIGGSNVAERLTQSLPTSYFFSQFSFVWGWASWRSAWAKMSLDLEGFEDFVRENGIKSLTTEPMAGAYMLEKFRATKARENNSWAYAWAYSVLKQKGLSIVPRINLVQNTGIGEAEATHTKESDNKAKIRASRLAFPLIHPTQVERPKGLDKEIFYASQKSRIRLTLWFLLQKFGFR